MGTLLFNTAHTAVIDVFTVFYTVGARVYLYTYVNGSAIIVIRIHRGENFRVREIN